MEKQKDWIASHTSGYILEQFLFNLSEIYPTIDIANIFVLTFVSQPVQQCAMGRTPLNQAEEASTQSLQTTTGEIL